MRMSLIKSKDALHEGISRFLWRQWAQLGVAGAVEFRDRWMIDPEALLIFTLDAARGDPRLFDEVVDWALVNGRWLSVQRLKNLCGPMDVKRTRAILAALAEFIAERKGSARWRGLMDIGGAYQDEEFGLFRDAAGGDLPIVGPTEPVFEKHGVLRSRIEPRGMSKPVPTDVPTNLILKLRAFFGVGARPDCVAYLLTHPGGYASEIARHVSYAQPSVQEALGDLAQSGLISTGQLGGGKVYQADRDRWRRFLRIVAVRSLPIWVDWPRVFRALSHARESFRHPLLWQASGYMSQSLALSLLEELGRDLEHTGLGLKPYLAPALQGSTASLALTVRRLVSALNPRSGTPSPIVPRHVLGRLPP